MGQEIGGHMARELDLQSQIIKSVRKDGGYGRKISHKFSVGIPDLLLGLFPFVPIIAEVKDFGVVTAKFDRQIDTTLKQEHELDLFTKQYQTEITPYTPSRYTSAILVRFILGGKHFLAVCDPYQRRLTWEHPRDLLVERVAPTYFNLAPAFDRVGIAKVRLM